MGSESMPSPSCSTAGSHWKSIPYCSPVTIGSSANVVSIGIGRILPSPSETEYESSANLKSMDEMRADIQVSLSVIQGGMIPGSDDRLTLLDGCSPFPVWTVALRAD